MGCSGNIGERLTLTVSSGAGNSQVAFMSTTRLAGHTDIDEIAKVHHRIHMARRVAVAGIFAGNVAQHFHRLVVIAVFPLAA
jgi:hypothetical protein